MLLVVISEADIYSLGDSSMATVLGIFKYPITLYGILEASLANKIYFINIKQFLRHGFKDSLCQQMVHWHWSTSCFRGNNNNPLSFLATSRSCCLQSHYHRQQAFYLELIKTKNQWCWRLDLCWWYTARQQRFSEDNCAMLIG